MIGKFLIIAGLFGIIVGAICYAASFPVVYFSWSTGECVQVYGKVGESCENLPRRYSKEWTK